LQGETAATIILPLLGNMLVDAVGSGGSAVLLQLTLRLVIARPGQGLMYDTQLQVITPLLHCTWQVCLAKHSRLAAALFLSNAAGFTQTNCACLHLPCVLTALPSQIGNAVAPICLLL
jgi:hypothetical protein